MSNYQFPQLQGLTWDFDIESEHSTDISTSANGTEIRVRQWPQPKRTFTLTYEFLFDNPNDPTIANPQGYTDLRTLVGFFDARGGSFDDFLLDLSTITQNPADGPVSGQLLGTGDGATTQFQVVRNTGFNIEAIQNLNGAPIVYAAGTVIPAGSGAGQYSISSTGLITFGTAPAAGQLITADYSWFYRVRFAADKMKVTSFLHQLYNAQQIALQQVLL